MTEATTPRPGIAPEHLPIMMPDAGTRTPHTARLDPTNGAILCEGWETRHRPTTSRARWDDYPYYQKTPVRNRLLLPAALHPPVERQRETCLVCQQGGEAFEALSRKERKTAWRDGLICDECAGGEYR